MFVEWSAVHAHAHTHTRRGSCIFQAFLLTKVIALTKHSMFAYILILYHILCSVFEMIHNLEIRKEWDKQFPVIDVIETHKHYRVVYWWTVASTCLRHFVDTSNIWQCVFCVDNCSPYLSLSLSPFRRISMPPGVADRDLVQNIGKRYDEATNSTFLLYRNASHPSRPPRSGIVRWEMGAFLSFKKVMLTIRNWIDVFLSTWCNPNYILRYMLILWMQFHMPQH